MWKRGLRNGRTEVVVVYNFSGRGIDRVKGIGLGHYICDIVNLLSAGLRDNCLAANDKRLTVDLIIRGVERSAVLPQTVISRARKQLSSVPLSFQPVLN